MIRRTANALAGKASTGLTGGRAAALLLTATLIAGCATPPADPVVASAGHAGATHAAATGPATEYFGSPWVYADPPGALYPDYRYDGP